MTEPMNSADINKAPGAAAAVSEVIPKEDSFSESEIAKLEQLVNESGITDPIARESIKERARTMLSGQSPLSLSAVRDFVRGQIKAAVKSEERKDDQTEINKSLAAYEMQEEAEYAKLSKAAKARISARSSYVDVDNPESVFNYYDSYLDPEMPEGARKAIVKIITKMPEHRENIARINALPMAVKETVAIREEQAREQLEQLLKDPRFGYGTPQEFVLRQMKDQHLVGFEGIPEILDGINKGTLDMHSGDFWTVFNGARTEHQRLFAQKLIASMKAIKEANPEIANTCSRVGSEELMKLFKQIQKEDKLSARVADYVSQLEEKKISFSALPEDMKQFIASFEVCAASHVLVDQSVFIHGAEELLKFIQGKEIPKDPIEAARIAALKADYAKLEDKTLSSEARTALLFDMIRHSDRTLAQLAEQSDSDFKKTSAALIAQIDAKGIASLWNDERVSLDVLVNSKAQSATVGSANVSEFEVLLMNEDNEAIRHELEKLKGQRLDLKTEKFFGLNGDAAHDAQVIVAKLEKSNVKLSAYDDNHSGSIDLNELARAMKATMSQDMATVSLTLQLVPDATPAKTQAAVSVVKAH
jgi:hypothetical protein